MADTKVSALTADASPSTDDLIYTVNDPGGTPAGRKVTLAALNTLLKSTTSTLTNHTIDSASNTLTVDLSEATVTGTTAEFNTALSDGSFATLAGTETLTNKTITTPALTLPDANGAAPTADGEIKFDRTGENLEVGDGAGTKIFSHDTGSATLQNKTIDSANNTLTVDLGEATVTGTLAEFNTAMSDGSFVSLAGSETLTNKTLTTPVITLPDANGAAPTTDGEIKYDRTAETIEVGTGAATKVFSADADLSITESQISDLQSYITAASADTLTNKTFDANGTGNSLSNVETADIASGSKSGADATLITGTAGTSGNLAQWNVDGDLVDGPTPPSGTIVGTTDTQTLTNKTFTDSSTTFQDNLDTSKKLQLQLSGITTATTRTLTAPDANGTIALTSDLSSYVPTSTQVIAGDGLSDGGALSGNVTLNVDIQGQTENASPATNDFVLVENNAGGTFRKVQLTNLPGGGGGLSNVVEDTTPQLGGQLDVNGNAIGDGTLELLSFTETPSAVNQINVTNNSTGNAPILGVAGDDANIDLVLAGQGTGVPKIGSAAILVSGGDLGTPSAGVATNLTGTASGLTAGAVSTITGLAPDTATTQATQPNITSAANLATVGTVTTGTWSSTVILADANGAAPTTDGEIKYDRTAETLEVGDGATTSVFSNDATNATTYSPIAGSASITTVGTVTTGTWNATAVAAQYGGTGQNWSSSTGIPLVTSGTFSLLTQGIADTNIAPVDATSGAPNSGEYVRFTASGLEGRTEAEFKADFNLEIGTDVQAFDADTLKADVGDTLTAGYLSDSYSGGTISSGTYTPAPATGQENFQHYTNNGAHTLAPPASPCSVVIEITNGASAGAITTSGFTVVDGDSFDTTNTNKFMCFITKTNASSYLSVKALQ